MKQVKINKKKMLFKKYLPHNFLAEKAILSCLILDNTLISSITKKVRLHFFYFKNHQEIYKIILRMHREQLKIDIIGLILFVQKNGLAEKIGGLRIILELTIKKNSLVYLDEYISLVEDKFIRRYLIKISYRTLNSSYFSNIPLSTISNYLENSLLLLNKKAQKETLFSSSELLKDIFSTIKDNFSTQSLPGVASGFYELDKLTQGFQKSDLIIVAGRPSMGKTAFSLNITLHVVKYLKLPVLFFSLEMSKEQIMYRLLAIESNISQTTLKKGAISKENWSKLSKTLKILSRSPFFINDSSNVSLKDIRAKIMKLKANGIQIGLVIIDYLQLMKCPIPTIKSENRVQELSEITRGLKIIARDFNLPILALSQLSRNVETRMDQKPLLSDLRESGSIEQDADLVIMLSKLRLDLSSIRESHFLTELTIAKQRNGPTGIAKLFFNDQYTKFLNL